MSSAHRRPLLYYISDGSGAVVRDVERLGDAIDFAQIRERNLEARELASVTRAVLQVAHPRVRILVNDRADVALACGAHGLHLRRNSVAPRLMRSIAPAEFIISVSCHSMEDVVRAEQEGGDIALLAPIFETPGKGAPLGLEQLERAAASVTIPVLALGGVTRAHIAECLKVGAAGVAGIRLFSSPKPESQFPPRP